MYTQIPVPPQTFFPVFIKTNTVVQPLSISVQKGCYKYVWELRLITVNLHKMLFRR